MIAARRSAAAACNCNSLPRSARAVHSSASTSAPSPTPSGPSSTAILASALVSRAPLVLPRLSPLASTYFAYQRRLSRALAQPTSLSTGWFFKAGSTAEGAFNAFDEKLMTNERGDEPWTRAYELAREEVAGAAEVHANVGEGETEASLERKQDRTLYLVVKKDAQWVFPGSAVTPGSSLVDSATAHLFATLGPNVDIFPLGKVPAGALSHPAAAKGKKASPTSGAREFFVPMRIVRGDVKPEGKAEWAWLTKEEIQTKVDKTYWDAVEPMLSNL